MHTGFYILGKSRIHYCYWGTGPKLLFCFHGYGESAGSFAFLGESLGGDYTLIAIDFPFHGKTEWADKLFFDPGDLLALLEDISSRLPNRRQQWTFLAYSMGGRVALQVLQLIPEKIEKLILLAPDGLQMNPWYWLATQTAPGNRLFRFTMAHPAWLFFLLRAGNVLHWVNPGIYKFTIRYIDDIKVRQDLYTRWTTMRGFRPSLALIRNIIRSRKTPVRLLYGRYDRIIRMERGEQFRKGIETFCLLQTLPSGHQLLQAEHLEIIQTLITS